MDTFHPVAAVPKHWAGLPVMLGLELSLAATPRTCLIAIARRKPGRPSPLHLAGRKTYAALRSSDKATLATGRQCRTT